MTDKKMKKVIHNLSTILRKIGGKVQNTTFFTQKSRKLINKIRNICL